MADSNPYLSLVPETASSEPAGVPASPESAGASAPLEQGNPYLTVVDETRGTGTPYRMSMMQVADKNPDVEARIQELGKKYGVPAETIRLQQPQYEQRATIDSIDYNKLANTAPATAGLLANPQKAAVSYDDTTSLSAIEKGLRFLVGSGSAIMSAVPTIGAGIYGVAQAGMEGVAAATDPLTGMILQKNPFSRIADQLGEWRRQQQAIANNMLPQGEGPISSGFYSGLQSAGMTGAAVATGGAGAALAVLAGVQGGQSYGQARDKGIGIAQAAAFGASQAAIEYATEKLPVHFLLKDLKAGSAFSKLLLHQMATEIPGEQVATALQDLNEWAVLNPEKPFSSYIEARPGAALQTLVATMVSVGALSGAAKGVQATASLMERKQSQAQQAQTNAAALTEIDQAAAESKLRPRDAATFSEFVKQATDDGGDVYIDVKALNQSGVDIAALAEAVPSVAAQLGEAVATGGQIRIPLDEFTTTIAGTEFSQALLPHLKTDPLGMSQQEAQEFMQSGGEQFKQEVERTLSVRERNAANAAFKASRDVVQQQITEQLNTVKRFTPAVNESYAALLANFYAVQGARLGVTPEEFAQQYPLPQYQRTRMEGEALEQPAVPADGVIAAENTSEVIPQISSSENATAPTAISQRAETPLAQESRGNISIPPDITKNAPTITILENADLSTVLHEYGHFFLEVMADIASRGNAPQEIKQDMQTALDWFGVSDVATWRGMTLDQQRDSHEKFARGFESYLFEGKAPSQELQPLFQKFRAWMVNVYRSLLRLNVTLSDEVRGVFDRMLATSDAIANQEAIEGSAALFDSAQAAGMNEEQWKAYQELGQESQQEALSNLDTRSLRNMKWLSNAKSRVLKDLQKQANAARAAMRDEVEAEVYAAPIYSAMQFLRRGTSTLNGEAIQVDGPHKLAIPALEEMYGQEGNRYALLDWSKLGYGKYGLIGKEGIHPNEAAQMFGFTSGDQLVRALLDAEPVESVIEGMTDTRMLERYSDLTDERAMSEAADRALRNETRIKFLATEVNALNNTIGQKKILASAAKQFAEQMIARLRVRDVRPSQYTASEGQAARAAEKAFKKGDIETAALEKRNQLVNTYAAKAAHAAQEEIQKAVDYFKKFDKDGVRKNIDSSYIDQIDSLLERFDFRVAQSLKSIDQRKTLAEWFKQQEEYGLEPVIDPKLIEEANRKSYKDMTVEELRGLSDAVKNIEHLGRMKKKLLTAKDKKDFEAAVNELSKSIVDNAKGVAREERSSDRGLLVAPRRIFKGFLAEHRKFASYARQFDGWKDAGSAWDYLVRTMNTAGDFEAVENAKATEKLSELMRPILSESGITSGVLKESRKLYKKQYFPSLNKSFSREEILAIALNMGNATNRERVLTGEKITPAQLKTLLNTLTEQDFKFVQDVWDYLETFRPLIAAKEKRLTGVEPQWVEAEPFTVAVKDTEGKVKLIDMKGGYYPIAADPLRSSRAEADINAEVQRQIERGLYTRAQTRRGHLKARTESTGRPLRYDLGVIGEHVQQVIHDLAWHEYLVDANRLLRASSVDEALRTHYGPEVMKQLKDTLKDIAVGQVASDGWIGKLFNHLRVGSTVAGLGWRLTTSLMQPLGLTQSAVRIGPKWVLKGAAHWAAGVTGMEKGMADMYEMSDFMRLRGKTMQREINEIQNRVAGQPKWKTNLNASFFYFIQKAQLIADVPTWWGAYEKAMSEQEMTEDKAIALADQAVRDAQGGGQIGDLARIQRGSPFLKLWTNFYSFFNTTLNLTRESFGRTDFKSVKSVAALAGDLALLYMIPAFIGTCFQALLHAGSGGGGDDDKFWKDVLVDQISYALSTVVGLRELTAAVRGVAGDYGGDYSGPGGARFFTEFAKAGKQIAQGEADQSLFKSLNTTAGILFHYPAGQINATVSGLDALADGRTQNPGALLVGAPPKK